MMITKNKKPVLKTWKQILQVYSNEIETHIMHPKYNNFDLLYYKVLVYGPPINSFHIEILGEEKIILPCKLYKIVDASISHNKLQHDWVYTLVKLCAKDRLINLRPHNVLMKMTIEYTHPKYRMGVVLRIFFTGYTVPAYIYDEFTMRDKFAKCITPPHENLYTDVKHKSKLEYFSVKYQSLNYVGRKNYKILTNDSSVWSGMLQFVILLLQRDVNRYSNELITLIVNGTHYNALHSILSLDIFRKHIMKIELDIGQTYVVLPICSIDAFNENIIDQYSSLGLDEYQDLTVEVNYDNKFKTEIKIDSIILCISDMSTTNTKDQVFIEMRRAEKHSTKNNIRKKMFGINYFKDVNITTHNKIL